jgi:hypothetical protein
LRWSLAAHADRGSTPLALVETFVKLLKRCTSEMLIGERSHPEADRDLAASIFD